MSCVQQVDAMWICAMCMVNKEKCTMYNVKCTHFEDIERRPAFKYNKNYIEFKANPNEQYLIYLYVSL